MPVLNLTDEQWEQIKKDAEGVEILSDREVERIVRKLQTERNLPFLNEEKEYIVFIKIVRKLDRLLYKTLPNEIYLTIRSTAHGIDPKEKREMIRRLRKYINKNVDIPYLPEIVEGAIIGMFLEIIVTAFVKGNRL